MGQNKKKKKRGGDRKRGEEGAKNKKIRKWGAKTWGRKRGVEEE